MNSKKKNKNRPKPSKIVPKVESTECGKPESIDNVINVSNVESVNTLQSEEKSSIALPVVDVAIELEKYVDDEVPKKPERRKGKKNQNISNDNDDKNKTLEEEQKINTSEENAIITPKLRKKKNKDKIQINTQEKEMSRSDEIDKIDEEDTKPDKEIKKGLFETPVNISEVELETKIAKKKKKKRNRHDSQKSDIDESTTCNIAFKNLLESTEDQDSPSSPKNDDTSAVDTSKESPYKSDLIIENDISSSVKDLTKTGAIDTNLKIQAECQYKNKKKGKRQKQPKEKMDEAYVNNEISSSFEKQEETSIDSHKSCSLEDSVVKAKIVKPVDKNRKVKSPKETTSLDNQEESISENVSHFETKCFEQTTKVSDAKISKASDTKNMSKSYDISNLVISDAVTSDSKESKKPFSTSPEIETVGKEQCSVIMDDGSKDIFMEVKSSKKKKKPKHVSQAELVVQENAEKGKENIEDNKKLIDEKLVMSDLPADVIKIDMTPITTEELSSTSAPDIIQYPRSSSQQLLSKDNMIIQEIPATEEVKSDISVSTAVPIIQGSGETPEVKSENDPMRIKFTEIDSKLSKCVEEKTDIKSKMMEVNKDMEELRLSIERSLAELTALDKDDKDLENTFQESKKSVNSNINKNESKETNSNISFPMPSSLVEKPISSIDISKNIIDPNNAHVCLSPDKEITDIKNKTYELQVGESVEKQTFSPVCPITKDNRGKCNKSKSKKKNKQESFATATTTSNTTTTEGTSNTSDNKNSNASTEEKSDNTGNTQNKSQEKGKQKSLQDGSNTNDYDEIIPVNQSAANIEPIENFEDALTSSVDDVNTTFEIIANEIMNSDITSQQLGNPQINIIAPTEDESTDKNIKDKQVTPPKNLLGHPDIPVPSSKTDYKKEKNKLPNNEQAKVKIKDCVDIEKKEKVSKQSQTWSNKNNSKLINGSESFSYITNANNEFVYKYSFRKVFLQSYCYVCKKELIQRFPCKICSLIFYCSQNHADEDWLCHQPLCFAVSTISHLKDQKHIYADAKGITGQDYRVLRMQMIVSCEKILKRKLVPWEQEALLYPRICADSNCREWRQSKLKDCKGCEQISFCSDHGEHLPPEHLRWCKSYALYRKLVNYQQTKGRLEPIMPTKILENYKIPEKINDVLASMYEEKIDMNDIQYAALTQLATAPLTVAYCYQIFSNNNFAANKLLKKTSFTVHVVGAELQFEADGLNKWEIFLLHLRPEIKDLRIVLINQDLNPSNLPLDLLGKVQLCENCTANKRRVIFSFQDKLSYYDYYSSDDYITPDIVCAFNASIQRSSIYNGKDSWPSTTQCILKQKLPFVVTSYTLEELKRDLERIKEFGDIRILFEPKLNPFASVRPDRNFITDHEIPLLFKNYCLSVVYAV